MQGTYWRASAAPTCSNGLGGNDILLGGGGADAFAFNTAGFGTDTVQDFATTAAAGANHDYVDFRGIGAFSSFAITQVGADTHIVTNHGTVILQGITAGTLVAATSCFEPYGSMRPRFDAVV